MFQKGKHVVSAEVLEFQIDHGTAVTFSEKS
jgi:hypothetical protein